MTSQGKVPAEAGARSPGLERSLSTSLNHIPVIRFLSLFPPDLVGEGWGRDEPGSIHHIILVHVVQTIAEEPKADDYEFIFHIS